MIPHKYLTVNKVNKGSSVQVTSSKNVRIGTQGFCVTTSISIFVLLKSTATTKSDFKCAVDIFLLPKVIARDVWLFKCALLRLVEYGTKLDGITCSVEWNKSYFNTLHLNFFCSSSRHRLLCEHCCISKMIKNTHSNVLQFNSLKGNSLCNSADMITYSVITQTKSKQTNKKDTQSLIMNVVTL